MLTYNMELKGNETLYRYLYLCIKRDIESGVIAANTKLPSKRTLAHNLDVSVSTIESAYDQLISEGYIRTESRRGYFVNAITMRPNTADFEAAPIYAGKKTSVADISLSLNATQSYNDSQPSHTAQSADLSHTPDPRDGYTITYDLSKSQLSPDLFPYTTWSKAVKETLVPDTFRSMYATTDSLGLMLLREQIARHLYETRGFIANPENILIGAGAQVLYNLLIQLLPGNIHVGLEDPGYPRLYQIYKKNHVRTTSIPIDASGLCTDSLAISPVSVLHIMPSHQYPTGIIMPISRRYELLSWATAQPNRYIIEDDYDCEFKLAGKPVPTLASIDTNERVIYANTFSKSLGTAFRIAYMVLPNHLAERFRQNMGFYSCTVSAFDQYALASFMRKGDFERYINKTRTRCRMVRNALIDELHALDTFHQIDIHSEDSGLHFILSVHTNTACKSLLRAFAAQGIFLTSVSEYTTAHYQTLQNDFIVHYAHLSVDDTFDVAFRIMAAVNSVKGPQSPYLNNPQNQ